MKLRKILFLTLCLIISSSGQRAEAISVFFVQDQNPNAIIEHYDIYKVQLELNSIFNESASYSESTASGYDSLGRSLLESYYHPSYQADTISRITQESHDVVILADLDYFASATPEISFEGVLQTSNAILKAGARPLFLMGFSEYDTIENSGEYALRIANGCGIEAVPAAWAGDELGLLDAMPDTLQSSEYSYLVAAMLFKQITGLDASVDSTYVPDFGGPLDVASLCTTVNETLALRLNGMQYIDSFALQGAIRYRPFDPDQSPLSGTVRYAYKGTSTENGISSHLNAILQGNGYTASANYIGASTGGTKWWVDEDLPVIQPYFGANPNQVLLSYARGAREDAQTLVDESQANLMPIVFDRHYDNIGTGLSSTQNVMDDVHIRTSHRAATFRLYGWNYIPFHIASCRLYAEDPTVVASTDGTHVTTPFYNMIASMMLTTIIGDAFQPTTAIMNNSQSLAGFNVGKNLIRQLAHLSETGDDVPDSTLAVRRDTLPVVPKNSAWNVQLEVTGGTPPLSWEIALDTALPEGLILGDDGLISGTFDGDTGEYRFVVRVEDTNGAFRKAPFRLVSRNEVIFKTDGTPGATIEGAANQFIDDGADSISILAVAPEGYRFVEWSKDGGLFSLDNPLTVENVNESMSLTAVYSIDTRIRYWEAY